MITKSKQELIQAVDRVFSSRLREDLQPSNFWEQFIPFYSRKGESDATMLLKLIQIPSRYVTSEEIIKKTKSKFGSLLHDVQLMLISRNLETSLYIVMAKQNLISMESYLKIKRQAGQKVQQDMIEKFLQFSNKIQAHPLAKRVSFSLGQIGITKKEQLVLTNYEMYFVMDSPKENTLQNDVKYTILRLITPEQDTIYLPDVYEKVELIESPHIKSIVEKCLSDPSFKVSEVITSASAIEAQNIHETTITDSFHSSQNQNSPSIKTIELQQSLLPPLPGQSKVKQAKKWSRKTTMLIIVFIAMLVLLGGVTFKYLRPRPLLCQDNQYLDQSQNLCMNCNQSCASCQGSESQQCSSCNEEFFLVKASKKDKVGKCSVSCTGVKIKNVCIINDQ